MSAWKSTHHRPRRMVAVSGVVLASFAGTPTLAEPAEPSIQVHYGFGGAREIMRVNGTGSADAVSIEPTDETMLSVSADRPVTVSDEMGTCVRKSARAVACPNTLAALEVSLGAGADRLWYFNLTPVDHTGFSTGSGPDRVVLSSGAPSSILVRTGPGDDTLTDHSHNPQQQTRFLGGSGNDVAIGATYARGEAGNDVLRARREGAPSRLFGGTGSDLVVGYGLDDELLGDQGADRIRDHGGDDVVYGGPGADSVAADEGGHDDINCGAGRDRVRRDWRDLLFRCEIANRRG